MEKKTQHNFRAPCVQNGPKGSKVTLKIIRHWSHWEMLYTVNTMISGGWLSALWVIWLLTILTSDNTLKTKLIGLWFHALDPLNKPAGRIWPASDSIVTRLRICVRVDLNKNIKRLYRQKVTNKNATHTVNVILLLLKISSCPKRFPYVPSSVSAD